MLVLKLAKKLCHFRNVFSVISNPRPKPELVKLSLTKKNNLKWSTALNGARASDMNRKTQVFEFSEPVQI